MMAGATTSTRGITRTGGSNALLAARPIALGVFRVLFMSLSTASAAPISILSHFNHAKAEEEEEGASMWALLVASAVLVILGGAFAGLTIAFMGQDSIYLQVVARDPSEPQQKNARRVHDLLTRGKHWVLVTLLLANVIVNESLPVVLDRCLGGGVAAVVGSTVLIVIFGEILPQSVCVRYGLQIGGYMSKPVLLLMYLTAPIAWPTAKLLDWLLGEDHGTVYKKSGLKTLVTLHKSLGAVSDRLNQDEVTIISAVLDLKEKAVEQVMTPMADVFVMSEDTVLDEKTTDMILSAGYSRIPIHEPGNPTNFVGMLLVKILITYDPEDCLRVRDFPLATLPETRPETSCLDIVNFFQEGKSHMALVSEYPGEDHGALGVVTLEDVIEELIGEEIIDESDVYIDVHKAIRRLAPAPRARVHRGTSGHQGGKSSDSTLVIGGYDTEDGLEPDHKRRGSAGANSDTPSLSSSLRTTLMLRRSSAGIDGIVAHDMIPVRANLEQMKQHLRHLGPSNPATNPKETRSTTVKVKPGTAGVASLHRLGSPTGGDILHEDDETTSLLKPHASSDSSRIQASRHSYGSLVADDSVSKLAAHSAPEIAVEDSDDVAEQPQKASAKSAPVGDAELPSRQSGGSSRSEHSGKNDSDKTVQPPTPKRSCVRSGSITESVIESRGVRKVVLQTTDDTGGEEATVHTTVPPGSVLIMPAAPDQAIADVPAVPKEPTVPEEPAVPAEPAAPAEPAVPTEPAVPAESAAPVASAAAEHISEGDEEEGDADDGTAAAGSSSGAQGKGASKNKKNRRKKRKGGRS